MGASFWKAHLIDANGRSRSLPDALNISPLAPWSADSRRYAYPAFDGGTRSGLLHVANVDGHSVSVPHAGYIPGLFWSPTEPLFLALGPSAVGVIDERIVTRTRLEWTIPPGEVPFAEWLASGGSYFGLGRLAGRAPEIRFYAPTGELLDSTELDPAKLVPYDVDAYRDVRRETWTLWIGKGTMAVGSLLDRWSQPRFDRATQRLVLAVYRPTGPAERATAGVSKGEIVAPASIRWVAVTLQE